MLPMRALIFVRGVHGAIGLLLWCKSIDLFAFEAPVPFLGSRDVSEGNLIEQMNPLILLNIPHGLRLA